MRPYGTITYFEVQPLDLYSYRKSIFGKLILQRAYEKNLVTVSSPYSDDQEKTYQYVSTFFKDVTMKEMMEANVCQLTKSVK